MHKKNGHIKSFLIGARKIFRARNVIIISEHKVDHVPLSGALQVLLLVGILGFFSGVSYITGSFVAARSALREKDDKIVSSTVEHRRISQEMNYLKKDLLRLSQNGKDLSTYSKYLVDERAGIARVPSSGTATSSTANASGSTDIREKLAARISFLEKRIQDINTGNDRLISAIRERTDKKITYLEDIIAMTGLDTENLEQMAANGEGKPGSAKEEEDSRPESAGPLSQNIPRANSFSSVAFADGPQGGPFIPSDATSFKDTDRELLANVDRLVVLHDIIEQLPLGQPISEAKATGPFGKRIDPINGRWAVHPGLDLAGPTGARIFSTSAGKVVFAGHKVAYGNVVDIDHGFGIVTRYAHMSKIIVKAGSAVHRGQQVGVQGSTGRSTGPHLHYEVRVDNHPVNPVKFLHAGEYVLEN